MAGWAGEKVSSSSSCALDVVPSLNNFPCVSGGGPGPWAQGGLGGLLVGFW